MSTEQCKEPMEDHKEKHLGDLREEISKRVNLKYRKGNAEHGGDIHDFTEYQLLENAIDEAIDQLIYLLTLRNKMVKRLKGRK